MNGKRAYTRSIDHVDNTGGTTTTRRQARFSFYPIFSAISGSMSATGNGKGSSSTPNNNATKVREVEDTAAYASDSSNVKEVKADDSMTTFSREDTHTHTLSSTLESNSNNNNTLVTESLSSKVTSQEDNLILGQYSSTFHSTSSFYIDQEDDADKIIMAPIPTHLSNNMGWNLDDELLDDHHDPNESSSLLSISQHSLKTASTNHSLQSDESMSGLECAGLEMRDTTTASRIQNFSNIEQDSSSMSKPADFDIDYGRHDLVIGLEPSKREGDQIVLKSANDGKDMTERNAILEALQYLHQRRLQRIQSSITTNIDPTMTKDQDNERSIPKPNTIFIAPPPLYPSITASQTHISTRIMKSQSETTGKTSSKTPPPILSASNLENCLLSPLVDVRQAVASSIPDMFRNSEKDAISLYKSLDYVNEEENDIDTSYLRDLNLAHSIHSNQYSSAPTSPRSKVVVVEENTLIVEEEEPPQGLLFIPISPPPRTQTHDSELKSKTGWVQFSEEDVLNPFSLPVHLSQMSPWKYTNKACTAADSILEEKIEKCIESILLSILERQSKDTTTDTKSSLGEAIG